MKDSKSNFQNVIRDYLDQLAEIDAEFAEKYRVKENQIEQCCAYIISEMHNLAQNNVIGVTDDEVYGLAIHYYLEDDLEVNIGVSLTFCTKVSLSIIFQKEAIIFICLNSQKRWFKRSL